MAIRDSWLLTPECPLCNVLNVRFEYWKGAFIKEHGESAFQRVYLKPGETKSIHCTCNSCGHEWEEYVEGVG
jgi:hypothetical protein